MNAKASKAWASEAMPPRQLFTHTVEPAVAIHMTQRNPKKYDQKQNVERMGFIVNSQHHATSVTTYEVKIPFRDTESQYLQQFQNERGVRGKISWEGTYMTGSVSREIKAVAKPKAENVK